MELIDGLNKFQSDASAYTETLSLEAEAETILRLARQHSASPHSSVLQRAQDFLVDVEKWKANCLRERMGNAVTNTPEVVWRALKDAVNAENDLDTIRSVMRLKGFGAASDPETGQHRAKLATAVLRFLWPNSWGVVDWRAAAVLTLFEKHHHDIDCAMKEGTQYTAASMRSLYDVIDEHAACELNRRYRVISAQYACLPRAADVDMALFGISMFVWPFPEIRQT